MALNTQQLQTLKSAIAAETDPTLVGYRNAGATAAMADWYNLPSTFIVFKSSVALGDIGKTWLQADVANLTTADAGRLQVIAQYAVNGDHVIPTADMQSGFNDIFSVAGASVTRTNLAALWRRAATHAEKLYATGTGTTASPGTLTFEGPISEYDVVQATTQV